MPRTKKADEEPIEATVEEPETNGTTALAVSQPAAMSEGAHALAMLTDEEFQSRLKVLKQGRDRVAILQRELMIEGEDFGLIPNTPKPTLFKSGAEKLCLMYRLAARLEVEFVAGDNELTPPLMYNAACYLHLGTTDGPVVATGHGTANSWEKRYMRGASKTCPHCGQAALIKSKYRKETWHCFAKKGGCGTDVPFSHPELATQTETKGAVTDAYDLGVTLMKMAEKRAFVDATLRATATSGLFTQDVVEDPRDNEDTVTTEGGAVVDTSTGEVRGRGREDSGYYEKHEGNAALAMATDDEQSLSERHQQVAAEAGPHVPTGDEVAKVLRQPDPDEPEFRTSDVEGVGRGGSTDGANGPQIKEVGRLSKSLGLGPYKLADEISEVLGIDTIPLPDDDRKEAGKELMTFLGDTSSDDIGKIISHLRNKVEAAP